MSNNLRRESSVSKKGILEHFDRTTLWLTGIVLWAVSGWQAARSQNPDLPNLGDKKGNVIERLVDATGQHFGPSWAVGFVTAAAYEKMRPQSKPPEQILVAASGVAIVNSIHEGYEVVTGFNALGVPVVPEVSVEDIIASPTIVALAGLTATAIQRLRDRDT